jgi:hypothetical protein
MIVCSVPITPDRKIQLQALPTQYQNWIFYLPTAILTDLTDHRWDIVANRDTNTTHSNALGHSRQTMMGGSMNTEYKEWAVRKIRVLLIRN